jgi:hypothetical protein
VNLIRQQRARRRQENPWSGTPVPLAVGVIPAVSAYCYDSGAGQEWDGALWRLSLRSGREAQGDCVELGPEPERSWRLARVSLPRSLPLLWRNVQQCASQLRLRFSPLHSSKCEITMLQGSSFGLGIALAFASQLFDCPVPGDLIASAALDGSGRLLPVERLEEKIQVIYREGPAIKRLLVAEDQLKDAGKLIKRPRPGDSREQIEVLGCENVFQAISLVFTDLSSLLNKRARDPEQRRDLVNAFFYLALDTHGAVVFWAPVFQGADQLLREYYDQLNEDQRLRLRFAAAIARRHESVIGEPCFMPDEDWLAAFPRPVRLAIVRQVVQQSMDTGAPAAEEVQRFARPFLRGFEGTEAFADHLRLQGALARLTEIQGQAEQSLKAQLELAGAWLARRQITDLSFQLGPAYRLSAALKDEDAFHRAEDYRLEAQSLGDISSVFLDLARGQALFHFDSEKAAEPLRRVWQDETAADHVRLIAARYLYRLGECQEEILQSLNNETLDSNSDCTRALLELDGALDQQPNCGAAIDRLRQHHPHLMRSLSTTAKARGEVLEEFVARFFPYG